MCLRVLKYLRNNKVVITLLQINTVTVAIKNRDSTMTIFMVGTVLNCLFVFCTGGRGVFANHFILLTIVNGFQYLKKCCADLYLLCKGSQFIVFDQN